MSLSIIGKLVDDSSTVKMRMNPSLITERCCGNQQDEEGNKRLGVAMVRKFLGKESVN